MVLIKAKAAHAFRRRGKAENFPHELLQFFVDHAAAIQDARDLAAFLRIFDDREVIGELGEFFGEGHG